MVLNRMSGLSMIAMVYTDCHPGIASLMEKEYKEIEHQFDVRHLSKAVLKSSLKQQSIKSVRI